MKLNKLFISATLLLVLFLTNEIYAKKKKSKKSSKETEKIKFDSKTLKCLVCRATVNEFAWAVLRIDPTKMIDTGTWRIDAKGENKRHVIPYARSQTHLMEVSENVCKDNFEEYAQAKWKKNGKPTIIRLQTHTGNMNPDMGKVDIVPDDNLNKSLKFHCESIIEEAEDDFLDIFAGKEDIEASLDSFVDEICQNRNQICPTSVKDEL